MRKIIFLTSLFSIPVLAATESPQIFVGVKGGYQWAQDDNYHHSDPSGAIWGIYSGLQFTPSWSWDVGYQYHDDLKADVTKRDELKIAELKSPSLVSVLICNMKGERHD